MSADTRPDFFVPFRHGASVVLKSYVGHNPDHKKIDMYALNWPPVVAAAPGVVHEQFDPGGIEIRHFIPGTTQLGNWFTVYLHMTERAAVGTRVGQGQWVGVAGAVGTSVKHLHFEQLHDPSGDGDADTFDMVFPAFHEYRSGTPFSMPLGEPGIHLISQNGSVDEGELMELTDENKADIRGLVRAELEDFGRAVLTGQDSGHFTHERFPGWISEPGLRDLAKKALTSDDIKVVAAQVAKAVPGATEAQVEAALTNVLQHGVG